MASREQVWASHILIKHQGSRRKSSWKDPEGRVICSTTKDAKFDDIVSGNAKFDDVASRVSDCSSAKRGGDLGFLGLLTAICVYALIFLAISGHSKLVIPDT